MSFLVLRVNLETKTRVTELVEFIPMGAGLEATREIHQYSYPYPRGKDITYAYSAPATY